MSAPLPREGEPGYQGPRISQRRRRRAEWPGLTAVGAGVLAAIAVGEGQLELRPVLLAPVLLLSLAAGWFGSTKLPPQASRGVRASTGAARGAGAMVSAMFGYLLATVFGLGGSETGVPGALDALGNPVVTLVVALAAGAVAGAAGAQVVAPRDPDAPPDAW